MTEKVYVVTDLGPGDGGKGGVVHKISSMMSAHTIIKVGGAQGSHGVTTSRGERFAFSQWGCGTFEGVRTHLSSRMVVSPIGLLNEADALRYRFGIHNAFDLLTIDGSALCATPFHGIASRLKEMARGTNPRGTIGTGVGEAYRDQEWYPELVVRASDLACSNLPLRLSAVRDQVRKGLEEVISGEFLPEDLEAVAFEVDRLNDDGFLDYVTERFQEVAKLAKIVDTAYLGDEILTQKGVAVVESSHGILTDHFQGFHPHTSAIRTLPRFASEMLRDAGYAERIVNIGVHRAYSIRHGAGPMPTTDLGMAEDLLPGSHKDENRYQGKVRVGPLDLVLLKYAVDACGGNTAFDGLAITWFDQIQRNGFWDICSRYNTSTKSDLFTPKGEIVVRTGEDDSQLHYQAELGKRLLSCVPEVTTVALPSANNDDAFSICADVIDSHVQVPVRMVSFGPTELDKLCR